ncbi:MAG TPA: nucleoside monophosphate kinase [Patescibacteria group bacterium]
MEVTAELVVQQLGSPTAKGPNERLSQGIYRGNVAKSHKGRLRALVGREGTGKNAIGVLMQQATGVPRIGTGDLIRAVCKPVTEDDEILCCAVTPEEVESLKARKSGSRGNNAIVQKLLYARVLWWEDCQEGFILDGCPRDEYQPGWVSDLAVALDLGVDVILLEAPEEMLIDRVLHRLTCTRCKLDFNTKLKPPVVAGLCDVCGMELQQRDEDATADSVRERWVDSDRVLSWLRLYYAQYSALYVVQAVGDPKDICRVTLEELLR